ncbi:MAG: hypothetical protein H7222_00465 [Methylotenera sp.]|nr:hypothetical protein [Oligoflexia bacterium]
MKLVSNAIWMLIFILTTGAGAQASVLVMDRDDWKLSFYGFVQTDAIMDSTRSFGEIAGNGPVDRRQTFAGDNGRTQFTFRNSRFGFALNAPQEDAWTSKAVMEFDFLGAGNPPAASLEAGTFNNPLLRARHFYFKSEKEGWQILVGQYWSLFGWEPNYFLITDSISPVSGVVFQRTLQFTVLKEIPLTESSRLLAGLSVVRPVQRDSRIPGLDAGIRYSFKDRKAGFVGANAEKKVQGMSFGLSGRLNPFEYSKTAGDTSATSHLLGSAVAVNGLIPLLPATGDDLGNSLSLSGEFSTGRGYSDAFPGFTGNLNPYSGAAVPATGTPVLNAGTNLDAGEIGLDSQTGVQLVHLRSFNLQLQYHLPESFRTFVTTGYGQLHSNNINSMTVGLAAGRIPHNRAETVFVNVFHDLSKRIRLAGEFDHFRSAYADGVNTHDNRVQLSAYFLF